MKIFDIICNVINEIPYHSDQPLSRLSPTYFLKPAVYSLLQIKRNNDKNTDEIVHFENELIGFYKMILETRDNDLILQDARYRKDHKISLPVKVEAGDLALLKDKNKFEEGRLVKIQQVRGHTATVRIIRNNKIQDYHVRNLYPLVFIREEETPKLSKS